MPGTLSQICKPDCVESLPVVVLCERHFDQWWVDPIIGLRTQINFTRWLFLALQGDVGGFGAGSEIAWFASGSIGINFTRHIFMETGYRYFYMDYVKNGLIYDAAQSGFFTGVGVKF